MLCACEGAANKSEAKARAQINARMRMDIPLLRCWLGLDIGCLLFPGRLYGSVSDRVPFVTQSDDGVDAHSAPRRHVASRETDKRQQDRGASKSKRVRGGHADEPAR